MTSAYLAQQLLNGLILGSMYALVAVGFSMIYGIINLINFAHGDIVMIGAFCTLGLLAGLGLPLWVVVPGVIGIGALSGLVVERFAFRPMRGAPQVTGFIASLGVSIMIQNLGILTLTAQPRNFTFPDYMQTALPFLGMQIRVIDLSIVIAAPVLVGILLFIVYRTKVGTAMRATAENLDVARLMGVNINRTIAVTFALGSALAGVSGLMWGGKFGQIDPLMGFLPGLKSFVAAVIGGVGSIPGAILGGYLLGMSEVLFVGLLPPVYSSYRDAFVFGTLIIILLVLPNGILGKNQEERA
ncbi:branched-chain amino acid ABC transporter permease [uncultured Pseudodesulfovibrio sp.]|uniref:branched-chain amino acid ABC transporter permease n=1 Tax=uncultured Pseudodesulfovibrio sp. TaxID=2035858 RepID=UPI0029C6274B|nr:branched-chain amino acid ABC transporter permease [uncultured Pseudodesulfovibrio sp.]